MNKLLSITVGLRSSTIQATNVRGLRSNPGVGIDEENRLPPCTNNLGKNGGALLPPISPNLRINSRSGQPTRCMCNDNVDIDILRPDRGMDQARGLQKYTDIGFIDGGARPARNKRDIEVDNKKATQACISTSFTASRRAQP